MGSYKKSLFIFHRDLRLHDNTGLLHACDQSETVIACFIFTPEQVGKDNEYRSSNAIQFMVESLKDLKERIENRNGKLYLFYGTTHEVVKQLLEDEGVEAVFSNKDYTPFAQKRDKKINKVCEEHDIPFHTYDDALLNRPGKIKTQAETPYKVFTPFWKRAVDFPIEKDHAFGYDRFYTGRIASAESTDLFDKVHKKENPDILVRGGRSNGLKITRDLEEYNDYKKTRDYPRIYTTLLSAHNKFGTISIRELYWKLRDALGYAASDGLIRQLYWRDFWYHIAYFFPRVFGDAFNEKYDDISWSQSTNDFEKWCEGKTGFPIVDAGMRQMNRTGWMHNRVRMIICSFLTKDLHINWLWGEKYFAQQLVDYDPCVNNGNWQWGASTGCDAQPYFRVFNPWLQQKKYDADCIYIKKWVPELKDVEPKIIHNWHKKKYEDKSEELDYPRPMVDHQEQKEQAIKMYKKAR